MGATTREGWRHQEPQTGGPAKKGPVFEIRGVYDEEEANLKDRYEDRPAWNRTRDRGVKTRRLASWLRANKTTPTGLEPVTFDVKGRCPDRLDDGVNERCRHQGAWPDGVDAPMAAGWLRGPESNRRQPRYEPGALPLRHPAVVLGLPPRSDCFAGTLHPVRRLLASFALTFDSVRRTSGRNFVGRVPRYRSRQATGSKLRRASWLPACRARDQRPAQDATPTSPGTWEKVPGSPPGWLPAGSEPVDRSVVERVRPFRSFKQDRFPMNDRGA